MRGSKGLKCWLALVLLTLVLSVEAGPKRLRVKTIANITAETTQSTTTNSPITTPLSTVITTRNPLRRRQRPPKPTTTQKTQSIGIVSNSESPPHKAESVTPRSRGRSLLRSSNKAISSSVKGTTVHNSGGIRRRNNSTENPQVNDAQPVQSVPRALVRPHRNKTSVYHFETGRISASTSSPINSTINEIPDQSIAPNELYKVKEETEDDVRLPQKRYSSRYRGPQRNASKVYDRSDHKDPPIAYNKEAIVEEEETAGQLSDGDYRELGGEPNDAQEVYQEQIVDDQEAYKADASTGRKDHNEEVKKDEGVKKETKGKGEEHHGDMYAAKGSHDKKNYKGKHHFDKGAKGFHDKEGHSGEYKDEKGSKKVHKEGGGHFESGEHGEKGEKVAEHAEKEEFKKGHSTRGGHVVHKKDEYEKKMEFYDESHESGDGEKFGAYFESHGGKKGGHKKGGHKNSASTGDHHAKKGHFAKGSHAHDDKGHDKKEGKQGMYGHQEKHGKKGSNKDEKKYQYQINNVKPKKGGKQKKENLIKEIKDIGEGTNQKYTEENEGKEEEGKVEEGSERIESDAEPDGESQELDTEESELTKNTKSGISLKKPYKNVQYMDEDGPTSQINHNRIKPPSVDKSFDDKNYDGLEQSINQSYDDVEHEPERRGNNVGVFMTEEQLLEDKEGDEALKVFQPLNHDDNQSQQEYRVAESDDEEQEPAIEESKTYINTVQVHTSYSPVQIVARYKLPPII